MNPIRRLSDLWDQGKATFKSWPLTKRIVVGSAGGLVLVSLSLVASMQYTSRPEFCPTCHYMEPYYESWQTASAHTEVACATCHFPPGIAGTIKGKAEGLVQVVNYLASSYTRRKPWAEIDDASCLQSGCHDTRLEGDVEFMGVRFDHGPHLTGQRRGKQLRCTSCHSQIVQGDHITVTETTCFLCHMKAGGEVEPETFEQLSNCTTCHHWESPLIDQSAPLTTFHRDLQEREISCQQCHSKVIVGDGFVPEATCFGCHSEQERLDKISDTPLLHEKHIAENKIECVQCHLQIQHKIQRVDAEGELECVTCHRGSHLEQVMLFTGQVEGVEGVSSPMFDAGLDCSGCHGFHEQTAEEEHEDQTAHAESCETCHGSGYNRLLTIWQEGAQSKLREFGRSIGRAESAIRGAGAAAREAASGPIQEARKIEHVLQIGKPVHNVTFYDDLIRKGYERLQEAAGAAGRSISLPEYTATSTVPGSCANCHTGVERKAVPHRGFTFEHELHVERQGLECASCHSNTTRHGQLVMSQARCNTCHHEPERVAGVECASCHEEVASIYTGAYAGEDLPDIMADAEIECIDCHMPDDHVVRLDVAVCVDCHDDDYAEMGTEWRDEVNGLIAEVRDLLRALPSGQRNHPDATNARTLIADFDRYAGGGLHNYELTSGLLIGARNAVRALGEAE